MKYWWVNQNQTYDQEVGGGFLWSPKTAANNRKNIFYDNMTQVAIGDVVFSFKDTLIKALGIITRSGYSSNKPSNFGEVGDYWDIEGWCVDVDFHELQNTLRPKDHIDSIKNTLPPKYSPLQENGNGNQGVYLAEIPANMAEVIINLIGTEAKNLIGEFAEIEINDSEESKIEKEIIQNTNLQYTEKQQLTRSRRGQGVFRTNLERIENHCRVTGLSSKENLIASHIMPWKVANNQQRLDGYNGLLLSPHIDHLFDKGYISFEDNGDLIISELLNPDLLKAWKIDLQMNVGQFHEKQKEYLQYHREHILKKHHG